MDGTSVSYHRGGGQVDLICPLCGAAGSTHRITAIDYNVIPSSSSLWPHIDSLKSPVLVVLTDDKFVGGDFRVAVEPGEYSILRRGESSRHETPLQHRFRDTVSVGFFQKGEAILLMGGQYNHEVSRVHAGRRATMSISVTCPACLPRRARDDV